MLKKLLFPLLVAFILAGCASNNTTLNIQPKIQLPQQDPSLMGVTVSVNGADQRSDQALAKVNRDGQLITLTPSRDLRFLLQEVLEKQVKNYRQTYSVEGAFSATNDKITNAVNSTLSDVIADMAQDTSVNNFIKQNAR